MLTLFGMALKHVVLILSNIFSTHAFPFPKCLQNIRAALEMLGDKPSMPVEYLFSEEQILKGMTSVIVPLLFQIERHGHHLSATSSHQNAE